MYTSLLMAAIHFAQWKWDLVGLAGALVLAMVQRAWHGYQQRRSETWPISYGRIDSAGVDSQEKKTKLTLRYTYRVAAETFAGSFRKTFDHPDQGNAWADALDKKQIAVRYDPGNPSRSQLREVDLEPMVKAAAPFRPQNPDADLPGWERILASVGLVLAIAGLAGTVAMLIGEVTGKPLIPSTVAVTIGNGAFVVLLVAFVTGVRGGAKQFRATAGWMKYLGYALFYYAILSATFIPSHGSAPNSRRHQQGFLDARFQLFLYFSALETCYARLHQREDALSRVGISG